jgi:hypothetical protein
MKNGAGDRDFAHGEQVFQMKVQTHAKHQEDHADLCELRGDFVVGDITGRERADQDACQQITNDG